MIFWSLLFYLLEEKYCIGGSRRGTLIVKSSHFAPNLENEYLVISNVFYLFFKLLIKLSQDKKYRTCICWYYQISYQYSNVLHSQDFPFSRIWVFPTINTPWYIGKKSTRGISVVSKYRLRPFRLWIRLKCSSFCTSLLYIEGENILSTNEKEKCKFRQLIP